ncbi:MAG: phosphoribosylformylglycinamidine synthase I [Chloroflexota bacterium]
MLPKTLILHSNGTNRDHEAAQAFELAGAQVEIVHLNQLRRGERRWQDYHIMVLPGGFSYADALGAGRLLALDLKTYFAEQVSAFVASGRPVIGICNGFQALVKAGVLPEPGNGNQHATLTFNDSGHFECRWVWLQPQSQACIWTSGLQTPIYCPVAHGEGKFTLPEPSLSHKLCAGGQIPLVYARSDGTPAQGIYPENPNGSLLDIAGVCNPQGNVLGLMPHPEDHIFPHQHPRWLRGEDGGSGLPLFKNGVSFAAQFGA